MYASACAASSTCSNTSGVTLVRNPRAKPVRVQVAAVELRMPDRSMGALDQGQGSIRETDPVEAGVVGRRIPGAGRDHHLVTLATSSTTSADSPENTVPIRKLTSHHKIVITGGYSASPPTRGQTRSFYRPRAGRRSSPTGGRPPQPGANWCRRSRTVCEEGEGCVVGAGPAGGGGGVRPSRSGRDGSPQAGPPPAPRGRPGRIKTACAVRARADRHRQPERPRQ